MGPKQDIEEVELPFVTKIHANDGPPHAKWYNYK